MHAMVRERTPPGAASEHAETRLERRRSATPITISVFGILAALAAIEHGVGEILQGSVRPDGLVIQSWPDSKAFESLSGEPAMTIVPDLLVTGILAVIAAVALGVWAVAFVERRRAGLGLVLLSVVLLLVGGGFGPPLIGIIVGIAATRIKAPARRLPRNVTGNLEKAWPAILGAAVLSYLGLVPGVPLLATFGDVENATLVAGLGLLSFGGLFLALAAARARDRTATEAWREGYP